jgi:2-methylfumaryl-CoA hydratase
MNSKTNPGNYFEDFCLDQEIVHATPRTLSEGDASLYTALYGARFAVHSSDMFAMSLGYEAAPIDDMLAFNVVFGKTVSDISLNAVANLGYAVGRFGVPVYPGDTLRASSRVIGLKENSNAKTGIVFVHSFGINQNEEQVLDFVRWVMVNKRDLTSSAPEPVVPELPVFVADEDLIVLDGIEMAGFDTMLSGSDMLWDDYQIGEKIDHVDGVTIEESDHMLATRLYQNTAKVHFNQHTQNEGRFGRRIVYGGHVISLARALTFNGLGNAFKIVAINGGTHVAPTFASDTIYGWSEVLGKSALPAHDGLGALRLRTLATKNCSCENFPYRNVDGKYDPSVVLDFDYTVLMPERR